MNTLTPIKPNVQLPREIRDLVFRLAAEHKRLSGWARRSAAGAARSEILAAIELNADTGTVFRIAFNIYDREVRA